jgi:hypothetical protein
MAVVAYDAVDVHTMFVSIVCDTVRDERLPSR